jgi:hypothetical protein
MHAGGILTPLGDIPNGQGRPSPPELVIERESTVIPVPMLARL